jgi:Ca2+-binding EF-hand superfamily protein
MKRALALLTLAGLVLVGVGAGLAQEEPDTSDAQDVVFLGEKRPVFLRLSVRHGEKSAFSGYDAFLLRLFTFLDRDKSGALNRTEAKQVPNAERLNQFFTGNPYLTSTLGRPGMMPPGGGGVNIEELDADKDGSVSLDELKTYYAGKGVGALLLSNQTATNPAALGDDALFALLDRDRDGKLSRAELQTALGELMRLDQDDDELLTVGELGINLGAMFTPVQPPRMMPKDGKGAKAPEPKFVIELLPRGDRRLSAKMDAARKIVAKYDADKDGKLTSAEIGWEAKALAKWDRNRDGKLDSLELGRWLSGAPESEHAIQLSATPGTAPMPRRMRAMPTSSDTLTLGNVQLAVVTQALTGSQAFDFKGQVLGQFRALDVDRHGYLTRRQLDQESGQALRGMLDMADRNNDSRLSREELTQYLDLVASAVQAQVSITLSTSGQGLYGTLDRNGDGFLSVRELREAWANLSPFAPEKAETLDRKDLPNQVRLTVGRGGNPQVIGEGMSGGPPSRPIPTRGPLWFRKMDTNGDGDLSAREWLGDPAQFTALDTDKDGLISLAEAVAYDAAQRK